MIWKVLKDRIVLDRMKDAAFHDAAIEEIAAGTRRPGLWAKALIEAHGDERMAKIAYVRLLVLTLKDEAYIADRMRETTPPPSPQPSPSPSSRPERSGFTPAHIEEMRRYGVIHNGKYYECGEMRFDKYEEAIAYTAHQHQRSNA